MRKHLVWLTLMFFGYDLDDAEKLFREQEGLSAWRDAFLEGKRYIDDEHLVHSSMLIGTSSLIATFWPLISGLKCKRGVHLHGLGWVHGTDIRLVLEYPLTECRCVEDAIEVATKIEHSIADVLSEITEPSQP